MASIILKINDQVPHKDLDKLRLAIVKSLKQQSVPIVMSLTDYVEPYHNDTISSQTEAVSGNS